MPLHKSKSKKEKKINKVVGRNIHELMHKKGGKIEKEEKKHGKEAAHKMAIAIAESAARKK